MKLNDRVTTKYGPGTIVNEEGERGKHSHRFCVALDGFDQVPDYIGAEDIADMQKRNGGIYCFDRELTKLD